LQTAERKFLEMQNLQSGQIKVGVSDTICKHYLIPYLEQYHNAYPKIKINVMNQKTLEIIDLLKAGTVDFGLINLPINSDETIIQRKLLQIQDCFVVGEKFKHLSLAPIPLEELAKYPILLLEESSSSRKFINGYFNQNNVAINPEIEISNIDLLIQFAKIGLGISCVVKDFIKEEIANNSLYEITLTEEIPKRAIGLATLRGVPLSSTVNKFIELLEG
jgi:LysR family cyn operon transcriptional activator